MLVRLHGVVRLIGGMRLRGGVCAAKGNTTHIVRLLRLIGGLVCGQERLLLGLPCECGDRQFFYASRSTGKAWVARIERVAMAAMYMSSIGILARADLFWTFSIQRIYYGMPRDSLHHDGMDIHMSTASMLWRLLQLSAKWESRYFANTLLKYVSESSISLTHVSSTPEKMNRQA